MRTIWRTADRKLVRDIGTLGMAVAMIGLSFGAIAVATGLPGWAVVAMSVLVFAGGAQFMAIGMLAAGSPAAAVLGGLLLNARHLPFGFAVAGVIGRSRARRLLGSHLMVDESVAVAMAQQGPAQQRTGYWLTGGVLFGCWNLGTVLGVVLGGTVGDPASFGLDAAFPAALLALLLPGLRDPAARRVALVGAAVATATTPLLPPGLPVLLGLVGLVAAGRAPAASADAAGAPPAAPGGGR